MMSAQHSNLKVGMAYGLPASAMASRPHLVYGTAWKKDDTARYVSEAVSAGFRFIDTACQPKHYNEAGVGNGWTAAAQELGLKREDFWLQTKFTSVSGQDPNNLPYDKHAPVAEQIRTSLQVSLKNLHTDYLDSWVMHSPYPTIGETIDAWRIMEEAVDAGKVRQLGLSNCYSLDVFREIYDGARHKPKVLQNRFYAESNFDTELRQFCKEHDITYQSFWTLSASRNALATREAHDAAEKNGLTPQTYMFAFLMSLGYITPLSGTTSPAHMAQDVAIMERIQGGEVFFHNEQELREFAHLLGMPAL
jgi:diketogulonate reductase-like aldo/keto reductase